MDEIIAYESEPMFQLIDENTIEVTKQVVLPEIKTVKYERSFIENQIATIQKQKDDFCALRDAELSECNEILAKMDALQLEAKN